MLFLKMNKKKLNKDCVSIYCIKKKMDRPEMFFTPIELHNIHMEVFELERKRKLQRARSKRFRENNHERILKEESIFRKENREKLNEKSRKWKADNLERSREISRKGQRVYYGKNQESCCLYSKKYREENPEKAKESCKKYASTDAGKKVHKISQWKQRGLLGDYDKIYERYEYTLFCDECKCDLDQCNSSIKCMDHCHTTGFFRNVLCKSCNNKRR